MSMAKTNNRKRLGTPKLGTRCRRGFRNRAVKRRISVSFRYWLSFSQMSPKPISPWELKL